MRRRPLFLLIPFLLAVATPGFGAQGGTETLACVDKSVTASAVRTSEDVQAFVQCAYEFVQQMGFAEARRAFHEDPRWRSGPTYAFVVEAIPTEAARVFVYPPDTSRVGAPWGEPLIDAFGNDWFLEHHRIVSNFGEGWIYYSFTNPATGRDEPKASYLKGIDWEGTAAVIGAGVYRRDIPGTCRSEEVNALLLEDEPSNERLAEFVRCADHPGDGITGVLRRPGPVERSPLAEPLDLPVRSGYVRQHAVQRRSLQPVVRGAGPGAERAPGGSLRGP